MTARVRTREWSGSDYYHVLGVDPRAPAPVVDDAYRRLAKELHPDRNPDAVAAERFKELAIAYRVLRDPATRDAYDDFRARVDMGTLYETSCARRPSPSGLRAVDHLAPPRTPRRRAPLPSWARTTISWVLVCLGIVVGFWLLFGDLPAPSEADTPMAVQITLAIMALKLVGCGLIVRWYPQLRARWDH